MRESLTVLAGLLVLTLLAALVGPGFVDWRSYRQEFETRLTAALGVETRVAGGIGMRLLPSPRLTLGDVRLGDADGATSSATVEQVTVELALAPLARGEFRFADVEVEGATLSLVADETGAVLLPRRIGTGLPVQTSLDRLSLRRSAVLWHERGKAAVTLSPVSAEISAVSLAGPWRVEGEVAGASLRLSTGEAEADGRLRAKASITGEEAQVGFDGYFQLPGANGSIRPGLDGAFSLAPGGAISLSGRIGGNGRQLDLTGLVVDIAGGALRLEGEGQFLPVSGTGSVGLRARRLDADALAAALSERVGFERALRGLPGTIDLGLDVDQVAWRGEDFSAAALRGTLTEEGLKNASASVRVAGALIGASGAADANGLRGKLNLKAEDARRVALALARAGLDPALADMIAALGKVDAEVVGDWAPERLQIERATIAGASGLRLDGSGEVAAERLNAKLAVQGLDLNTLPPGESFAGLIGRRDLALDLTLNGARYRNAPPGSARLDLRREGASWRLSHFSVDGFGGVAVTGAGALLPEGGEIAGRIRAPRFETLAALAGPILPDSVRQSLARVGEGLSRLDANYRLTRAPSGDTALTLDGGAQAGKLTLNARLDAGGTWTNADLGVDLGDRRQIFTALGLPVPQLGGSGRFTLSKDRGRLAGSLAGAGLSIALDADAAAPRLTVQADRPGQILPEGPARLLPDELLDANARVRFAPDQIALDDLVANLGGGSARGSLVLPREGAVTGKLALQRADLRALLGASLGGGTAAPGVNWSTARFSPVAQLGDLGLAIETPSLRVNDGIELRDASFELKADSDGLKVEKLAGSYGGGKVSGQLSARREGGLAQLTGRVGLAQVDLAGLSGGALGGKVSGQFEAGGSGESPARLVAGLGGAGSLTFAGATLAKFDPSGYARVIAATGEDASESESARLQDRLSAALDQGAWQLGDVTLGFTLAGGIVRLSPTTIERSQVRAEASGLVDLRALNADLRLGLRPLGAMPKGWTMQSAPPLGIAWRGPLSGLRREADVSALSNAVAARALAREIERVEAFEADARERAMYSRRLRAEREMRENERKLGEFVKAEEERRIVEAKRAEEERKVQEARRIADEKKAEDDRRALEARIQEETRRAQEAQRVEEARRMDEMRRRMEAEERARAIAERASQQQPGPLILPGSPREIFSDQGSRSMTPGQSPPPLAPPVEIESVPRPLSRTPLPN
ncbi:AsmA family protein [Bosea caraganae]|uniref:AsmA family protein n=1 Tax=Bosea caraganae TaxID=2763117 RepID=A0A370LB01_9HYPH|nr:AsmA family protein [Bosea caraganae]RDJ27125.1 AsmA family protein [Bosea caraganae]RDJ29142.1 AsmA family protein [Bosea caraganae]